MNELLDHIHKGMKRVDERITERVKIEPVDEKVKIKPVEL